MRRQYFDYRPRPQFRAFHRRKERFACIITHRRAGKTVACIHELQRRAIESTKKHPRFAYLSPLLKQSKTVAWDYLRDAMSLLRKAGATVNETELRADYPNGGQVRLYGADNPDALRGFYLDGVVLDEYADMDPRVWPEIIRPCLSDREGWAVFIGTPRGRNSLFKIWQQSRTQPGWFSLMLKASESGLLPQDELAMARADCPRTSMRRNSNLRIAPAHRIEDGIDAVRMFLPKCWFDAGRCARGIEALKLYRSGQDDKLQVPKPNPVHDWTSHAADAFRYLAMTLDSTVSVRNFSRRLEYPNLGIV